MHAIVQLHTHEQRHTYVNTSAYTATQTIIYVCRRGQKLSDDIAGYSHITNILIAYADMWPGGNVLKRAERQNVEERSDTHAYT
jgi:hypothetical protein